MAQKQHFAILDGLRGVAALVVVAAHVTTPFSMFPFPHGGLAVDFFFALSGFVVAFAYEERLLNGMTFLQFCRARIFRLHPLIVVGMTIGALGIAAKLHGSAEDLKRIAEALAFGLFLLPTGVLAASNASSHPLDPPAWSLLAEYLVNFVYGAIVKVLSNLLLAGLIAVGAGLVLTSSLLHHTVVVGNNFSDWPWGLARVVFPFFSGVAIYRGWRSGLLAKIRLPFALLAAALLIIFAMPAPWEWETAAVLVAFPFIVSAGAHVRIGDRMKALALQAGRLSYPLYILHYPLVPLFSHFARARHFEGVILYAWMGLEITTMVIFAFAMTLLFDEPVRRWLTRRLPSKPAPAHA